MSLINIRDVYKMELRRTDTPFNIPEPLARYQRECTPYSIPPNYPGPDCRSQAAPSGRPFGYQPQMTNPGDKLFYQYRYPFQTQFGKPYSNKGKGWARYQATGVYPFPRNFY